MFFVPFLLFLSVVPVLLLFFSATVFLLFFSLKFFAFRLIRSVSQSLVSVFSLSLVSSDIPCVQQGGSLHTTVWPCELWPLQTLLSSSPCTVQCFCYFMLYTDNSKARQPVLWLDESQICLGPFLEKLYFEKLFCSRRVSSLPSYSNCLLSFCLAIRSPTQSSLLSPRHLFQQSWIHALNSLEGILPLRWFHFSWPQLTPWGLLILLICCNTLYHTTVLTTFLHFLVYAVCVGGTFRILLLLSILLHCRQGIQNFRQLIPHSFRDIHPRPPPPPPPSCWTK